MRRVLGVSHGSHVQKQAEREVWVLHGSQAWGGMGLGRPKMKHENRGWLLHGSQEWGGKGLGRLKMVPKNVVGMVWEGQK